MILVFGGAYQGKTEFVEREFGIEKDSFYDCAEKTGMCYDYPVINALHLFILGMVQRGDNPIEYITRNMDFFRDKIIICDDVSCGIVPLGKDLRLYRDNTGKIMQLLSRESDEVYRVFCGMGERLK
jgi:adenosyl cobinamide kinase/adenosyl cobinamide phosphate guanylyltransferase